MLELFMDGASKGDVQIRELDEGTTKVVGQFVHGVSKALVVRMIVAKGRGGISLSSPTKTVATDAYLAPPAFFLGTMAGNGRQITAPGTALNVITVGSYDFNEDFHYNGKPLTVPNLRTKKALTLGQLSDYSNAGYLRNQKYLDRTGTIVKPDIVAPGQFYAAPASGTSKRQILYTGGKYQLFNGTSAATPYVAGVAALLLQERPGLTVAQFRDLLAKNASRDDFTGAIPNTRWGYGKLDLAAVERMVRAVKAK